MSTKLPKNKGSKSKPVVLYKDVLASDTVRNSEVDPMDLEETAASGSEGGSPISEEEISEEEERKSTEVEEIRKKKKSRKEKSDATTLEEAIGNLRKWSYGLRFSNFRNSGLLSRN